MTRKRSRHTDSREFFNETHEPNSPPSNKKTRGKQTSTQNQSQQPPPVTQPMSIEHRLVEKRKRVKIQPKNLSQEQYLLELNNPKKQIVFAIGPAGTGKAQPLTAKIKIPGGWTTMGDIKVGDLVSTPDGLSAAVTGIFPQGIKQTYSVTLHDGRTTTCCAEHLWEAFVGNKPAIVNTMQLHALRYNGSTLPYIRLPKHEIMDDVELPDMDIHYSNEIPTVYLHASRSQKVKLLQSLLGDSTHSVDSGNLIVTGNPALENSIVYLVRSIGGSARVSTDTGVHLRFTVNEPAIEKMPVLAVFAETEEECQCIMIDSTDHLYITDDFIVTHNTLLATQWAVDQFKAGKCDKIIVTRPAVSNAESLGYLPGNLEEKMLPWTVGMFDVFYENWTKAEVEWLMSRDYISISPMSYMRGRTMKNACVIADEVQLCNPSQMKMLLTRIGDQSKMILTGDLAQADRGEFNGLKDFMGLYDKASVNKEESRIAIVRFSHSDIERHPAVAEVLKYYGED